MLVYLQRIALSFAITRTGHVARLFSHILNAAPDHAEMFINDLLSVGSESHTLLWGFLFPVERQGVPCARLSVQRQACLIVFHSSVWKSRLCTKSLPHEQQ